MPGYVRGDPFRPPFALHAVVLHEEADPRGRDYPEDRRLWEMLLVLALWGILCEGRKTPADDLAGALHYLRCCGAHLARFGNGLRLEPRLSPKVPFEGVDEDGFGTGELLEVPGDTGWSTVAEWRTEYDAMVRPHAPRLARLLMHVTAAAREANLALPDSLHIS